MFTPRTSRRRGLDADLHQQTERFSIQKQLLHRNVQRFRGWLVFKSHRLVYHSPLDLRVMNKKDGDLVDIHAHSISLSISLSLSLSLPLYASFSLSRTTYQSK